MRIAVLSDFHFGYGYNTELEEDSFSNAEEALERASEADLIINAGDIFDTKFPNRNSNALQRISSMKLVSKITPVRLQLHK